MYRKSYRFAITYFLSVSLVFSSLFQIVLAGGPLNTEKRQSPIETTKTLANSFLSKINVFSQDPVGVLLEQWATKGKADDALVNQLIKSIDISKASLVVELEAKIAASGKKFAGGAPAFRDAVIKTLDRKRFQIMDKAIQEVLSELGDGLEVVVRTGSSGVRHLELKGVKSGHSGYRLLFSDDDVTFVGTKAAEASRRLNEIIRREGLQKLKVKGFDLVSLKNVRRIDLTALNYLESEKFIGEAGLSGIKEEMLVKGVVVAEKTGDVAVMTAQPLRGFVEAKKSKLLAEILDEKAVRDAVRKYGSLTMVGSCERQIVNAHGGWKNLPDAEKAKYVLRQRIALAESGALKNIAGEGQSSINATLKQLRELRGKASLSAEEVRWLAGLRNQNIDLAFKEIPVRLQPILDAAENSGRSLASNSAARSAMDELTAGFALMRERILDLPEEEILKKLRLMAGENKELYSMLYTSYQQSQDLVQMADQWIASGKTREAFIDMLQKAESRLARLQAVQARKARKLGQAEGKTLDTLEDMLGTESGDNFFMKMAKNPAAKKVLLATLVAVGGSACLYAMYRSYMNGTLKENLSDAAFALIDFVPGGIGLKRGLTEGMDTMTTLLFIKDALYLTPAWPLVLAGDILVIAIDLGGTFQVQNQHEGLMNLFVYDGVYDLKGDRAKFLKLSPPDGRSFEKDGLRKFLFETKAVKVNHPIKGKEFWINDLSQISTKVRDEYYIPADSVTQQLRLAAETQLAAINKGEAWDAAESDNLFAASKALGRWYFGFDTVCKKSPAKWCKVFRLLETKIREREAFVTENVMIPHLIELAEAKKSLLTAADELDPRMVKLQENIESVRGGRLDNSAPYLSLAQEVRLQAESKLAGSANDTSEQKSVKRGQHWQSAFDAYTRIWEAGKTIQGSIEEKSGWAGAKPFQFDWTGDYVEDERRADQSRQGFATELSKIRLDIRKIKGEQPSPLDLIDKQAFGILSNVVFPWRVALDKTDRPDPNDNSRYVSEYEGALDRVKALYAGSAALQEQLGNGAVIVKEKNGLTLGESGAFELRFNDKALRDAYDSGRFSIRWTSSPGGTFRPNSTGLKTSFSANRPEPAKLSVTIEKQTTPAARGVLEVTVPIRVPNDFLSLELSPRTPKKDDISGIAASIPDRFYGGEYDFRYRWDCENCEVDDVDRSNTALTTPNTGNASVSCELLIADSTGKLTSLVKKTHRFSVTGNDVANDENQGGEEDEDNNKDDKTAADEKKEADKKDDKTAKADSKDPKSEPSPIPSQSPESVEENKPAKLMFGGTASNIWEGENNEKGFRFKRKSALSKGTGYCKWEAHLNSEVWGKIDPSFAPRDQKDLTKKIERFADGVDSDYWGTKSTARSYSIGEFKGQFSDTNITFRRGGASPDAGYRWSRIGANGSGWVIKDRKAIEVGYNVSGGGCWENSDRAFLERQASAAQKEAVAIINGLTLTGGDFSKIAYTGPKLDGSDMPTLELVIDPDKKKLRKGEIVQVRAVVKNADAEDNPIQFEWTGDHGGKGANVQFIAEKPGKQTLSVVATGANYQIGSASVEFEIADLKAEIRQITPETKVAVGTPVSFAAQLLSEGKPASGNYIYRFQPSPAVEFGTNESAKKQTTATFSKPGIEKIWVVILEQKGDSLETVAESEQIEIEVIEPKLKITFDQEKAMVGKAVKAKVDIAPADLKNIDFRWEISSNAKQTLESQDSKEVTFIPQDGKPITVKVTARVRVSGEDLGDKTATITAQSFEVSVNVLGTIGVKPQIWKEGVGLVTVDKGIAVFQNVGMKAVVTPQAENLRYRWTLNEDSHFVGTSSSAEIRANRSQTGTCVASVVVTDKDGIELGRGTASFNVSISQDELTNASNSAESAEKSAKAKTISRKGEIDEAIKLAEEAATLNPKNRDAKALAEKLERDKQTIETQMVKTRQLISQSKFPEAQKALIVAKNLNPYYKPTVELEKEMGEKWRKYTAGVRAGLGNIRVANQKKDFKTALNLAEKLRSEYQLTPSSQKELTNYEQWAKKQEAEKERQRGILARGESKFNQGDYAGAIKDFDVIYPNFGNYWNVNIDKEPKKYGDLKGAAIKRQKRIAQLVPSIKRTIELNAKNEVLLNQALKNVEELISYQPGRSEFQQYRTTINELLRSKANEAKINPIMQRGDTAYNAKRFKDAIREYDKVISIAPDNVESYRKRAMAKRRNGDRNGALRDYSKTLELDPDNHQAFLGRGLTNRDMKKYDQALSDFGKGIQLAPNYANGYSYRGHLRLTQTEDYKGAISDYNSVIRLDPRNSAAFINRGLAKSKLGDENGAFRDYNQAILIDPKNSLAYNNRATIKEKRGDLAGARSDYEKAIQVNPGNKLAKSNLAKLNAKIRRDQTANTKPPTTKRPPVTKPISRKEVEIANVNNVGGVRNKPTAPTRITVRSSYMVTFIQTYHWNSGRGTSRAGTIGLRRSNGKMYGPWRAYGTPGQGGVKNAYWQVEPNVVIPAGTYTIIDSNPSTWAQNSQSGGKGFATVKGYAVTGTTKPPTTTAERMRISVTYVNASRKNVHIFATGEKISSANRLSPGRRRTASGEGPKFSRITVYAGVNGKVIHRISFNVVPNGKYTVTFGTNNKLSLGRASGGSTGAKSNSGVSGRWRYSSFASGTINLTQSGSRITGNYQPDEGRIFGTIRGSVITGYWVERSSNVKCSVRRDGSYYWGTFRWQFSGNKFVGTWFYCERTSGGKPWTGSRIP